MSFDVIAQTGFYIIGTLGGAGAIILGLSAWLGKVWANRLMEQDRAKHAADLEALRASLAQDNNRELEQMKHDLSIFKEHHLRGLNDKLLTYRLVIDLIAEVLADFDLAMETGKKIPPDRFDHMNRLRLKAYGYLAMMASQPLMDAQDQMMDYLLQVANGSKDYDWPHVRGLAHGLLNEMRKDLKFDETPITYNGEL